MILLSFSKQYIDRITGIFQIECLKERDDLLVDFLGGAQFHIQSNEQLKEKIMRQYYDSNHISFDPNNLNKCLEQCTYPTSNQTAIQLDKTSHSQPCMNDITIKHKPFMISECDNNCNIPEYWAIKVSKGLHLLVPCLNFKLMQLKILEFEKCDDCYTNTCTGKNCTNNFKLLAKLSKHYQGIRTLIRYKILYFI